jgi:hypothetical protein
MCCIMYSLETLSEHIEEAKDDRKLSQKWNIPMIKIFYARVELGVFYQTKRENILTWTKEKFLSEVDNL